MDYAFEVHSIGSRSFLVGEVTPEPLLLLLRSTHVDSYVGSKMLCGKVRHGSVGTMICSDENWLACALSESMFLVHSKHRTETETETDRDRDRHIMLKYHCATEPRFCDVDC